MAPDSPFHSVTSFAHTIAFRSMGFSEPLSIPSHSTVRECIVRPESISIHALYAVNTWVVSPSDRIHSCPYPLSLLCAHYPSLTLYPVSQRPNSFDHNRPKPLHKHTKHEQSYPSTRPLHLNSKESPQSEKATLSTWTPASASIFNTRSIAMHIGSHAFQIRWRTSCILACKLLCYS